MKIRHLINYILFFVAFTFCINLYAQVKTKVFYTDVPPKFKSLLKTISKTNIVEPPLEFYNLKKKTISEDIQFAIPVKMHIDFIKEALLEENTDMNLLTYSLSLEAKDALNLSLQFSEFKLPESAILSIYTKNELTDSITSSQNNENNIWATRVYQGNILSVVLKVPRSDKDKVLLKIGNVNFGYKKFGVQFDFANPGASATCHINANCPAGNNWNNEKNSVAMIVANGIIQCTGSLIMNTCNTNTPYFLTANHCLGAGNVPNWVFQFQTLSTDCVNNVGWREDIQFNGCVLRANNGASDFALLQLNIIPAANSGLFYSGWSRQTNGNTSTTILHHPAGDLMKISVDNQPPTAITSLGVDVWQIDQDLGRLQGGSSGAPYYNQNHQIIGQHWRRPEAGTRPICDITVAQGGRFDRSWVGGGTNATRLSNWLDPSNNGFQTTNTTNIANLTPPQPPVDINTFNISGPNLICNSSDYLITNLPTGAIVSWSIPSSAGPVLQLLPNTPSQNQLRINNQKWYGVTTTLTAIISNLPCSLPNQTRVLTIANDNSTSASIPFSYYQEACNFYNVSHPSQSGSITSNSSPVFVHQGCMVYVNLGDMTGKTVSLQSGSGQPLYWGTTGGTSYFPNSQNLIFQLPLGSGGIPFTFQISGNGACYTRTLLFFSYSGNARYAYVATPNPVKNQLILTVQEDEKYLIENKLTSMKDNLQFTMNVYDLITNSLQLTQSSTIGSLQHQLNVSKLKKGYYVLQIINGKETMSIKFLKE